MGHPWSPKNILHSSPSGIPLASSIEDRYMSDPYNPTDLCNLADQTHPLVHVPRENAKLLVDEGSRHDPTMHASPNSVKQTFLPTALDMPLFRVAQSSQEMIHEKPKNVEAPLKMPSLPSHQSAVHQAPSQQSTINQINPHIRRNDSSLMSAMHGQSMLVESLDLSQHHMSPNENNIHDPQATLPTYQVAFCFVKILITKINGY